MRVFDKIIYNMNGIMLGDKKAFVDNLLKELGIHYRSICFDFVSLGNDIESKIKEMFPDLAKDRFRDVSFLLSRARSFTSFRADENGNVLSSLNPDQIGRFEEFLRKIPKPINPSIGTVVLDMIDWYKDGEQNITYYLDKEYTSYYTCGYYSNSIRIEREFGSDNTAVTLMIDRTGDRVDTLREYPENFLRVMNALGKPDLIKFCCFFDPEEKAHNEIAQNEFMKSAQKNNYCDAYNEFRLLLNDDDYIYNRCASTKRINTKAIVGKIAEQYGYKYVSFDGENYICKKIIENNYIVTVKLVRGSGCSLAGARVAIDGWNFCIYPLIGYVCTFPYDTDMLRKYVSVTFDIADKAAEDYFDLLNKCFGKTPRWFADRE